MTLVRRLSMAAGNGGGFVVPAPVQATLTSSPDGGWTYTGAPVYYNGKVYFGWVDSSGNIKIATYTESTGTVSSATTLHAALEVDWHDGPAILVRDDGKIVTVYCKHAVAGGSMYVRISSAAEDISAFGSEADIDSQLSGDRYTYPVLFMEPSGKLWLFYRHSDLTGGETSIWCYSTSTDGGVTWAVETQVFNESHVVAYLKVNYDGASRFDFAVTNGTGSGVSMYHFYMNTSGALFKSDGTSAGSAPLDSSDCTLVHNGAGGGARYPAAIVGTTIAWPELTGGAEDWYYATYTGGSWSVHNVVSDGTTGAAWVEGGFSLEYADPTIGWLSRSSGGHYNVHRYRTFDGGSTWQSAQISSSPSDDFYPLAVRDAHRLRAIWLRGTASSFTSYTLQAMGGTAY